MNTEQQNLETAKRFDRMGRCVGSGHHLKSLRNRLAYLIEKIESKKCSEKSMPYLKQERAATEWAIEICVKHLEAKNV